MKKTLLSIIMSMCSLTMYSQTYNNDGMPYYFYCEMTAQVNLAGKMRLTLEWDGNKEQEQLRDEKGEKIEFSNVAEMLNYMSKRGWDLNQTYSYSNVLRFLFRKLVKNDAEAKEGLIFKSDKK